MQYLYPAIALMLMAVFAYAGERFGPDLIINPIDHASFVMETPQGVIYVDPVGEAGLYANLPRPALVLITHTHHDHFDPELLEQVCTEATVIVGNRGVGEKMENCQVMANGDKSAFLGIPVKAVPAYNTTKDRLQYHPKGVGNGYVVEAGGRRIYISGDTEDIPEMRKLKNIDIAFICMNLPYTMTVEQAASAVVEFKPKTVIPYHCRGRGGMSDLGKFKQLVGKAKGIEVKLLEWYKE